MARPKRQFSEEEVQEIKRLALINCKSNTIAVTLGIPIVTLERRFGKRLKAWRGKWRVNLRQSQANLKETSADMCKFLGKNDLGQTDKTIVEQQTKAIKHTPEELDGLKEAAKVFKLRVAKG